MAVERFDLPFAPPPGINTDDTIFKAEGRWSDGDNVRFVDGSPQVIGPFCALWPTLSIYMVIYGMFAWDRSGTTYIAYGTNDNVTCTVHIGAGAASPTNRTPTGMGTGYTAYAFASWGTDLLFVPSGKTLYQWQGSGNATEITQAPDKITWMLSTSQRQVIAFGCNEAVSGTFNDRCIRGSDLEDNTNWTPTPSNNSFEDILDVGGGKIVTARQVGSYIAVLTDSALFMGTFIGDPSQTYRWDMIATDCGIVGPNAATVVGQRLYWLGHDLRVHVWAPGTDVATVPCPIINFFRRHIFDSALQRSRSCMWYNNKFDEVWISYGTVDLPIASIAVSLKDGSWFKSSTGATFALCSDNLRPALSSGYGSNLLAAFIAPDHTGGVAYAADCGALSIGRAGPLSWYIQSADQYLDNGGRRIEIQGIKPDFTCRTQSYAGSVIEPPSSDLNVTLYMRDRPQSAAVTKGPYVIAAGATKKDFRASGMIASVRFDQSGAATDIDRELRIGKPVFNCVTQGGR